MARMLADYVAADDRGHFGAPHACGTLQVTMHKFFHVAIGLALAGAWHVAAHAQAGRGTLADAPNARLFLTIDLQGTGRKDLPNKVEWYRLASARKYEVELLLTPLKSPAPIVKVGGIDKDNAPLPAGMEAMRRALEPCKGDEACQRKAMTEFGQRMMANPQAVGAMKQDDTRFENWVTDWRGPCAKGTLTVQDEGDGMNISPPNPAKPYRFQRAGRLDLAGQGKDVLEKVCQAEVSVDRHTGLLSLRLNRLDIAIPVRMSGQAFTFEKSVPFLERQGKLELSDQKIDVNARSWTGQARIEKAGTVSHNSGQTVAPMAATVGWRLVRN
jgi:hypothetical protein